MTKCFNTIPDVYGVAPHELRVFVHYLYYRNSTTSMSTLPRCTTTTGARSSWREREGPCYGCQVELEREICPSFCHQRDCKAFALPSGLSAQVGQSKHIGNLQAQALALDHLPPVIVWN